MRNLVRLCCALAVAALITAASSPTAVRTSARARVVAGVITVNSTADVVMDDGQCTLREALSSAANDAPSGASAGECAAGSGDDTININVTGIIDLSDMLSTTTNVSIVGPGSGMLTLRSTGTPHRVFFKNVSTVSISGVTMTKGGFNAGGGSGGGLINGSGVMTLTDVVITDNHTPDEAASSGSGGGIYNSGALTLINCVVSGNSTGNSSGGEGGRGGGIDSGSGSLTLINTVVSGNSTGSGPTKGGDGGGIFIGNSATLTNSTVSGNTAGNGGSVSSPGNGKGGDGGGIFNVGTLTVVGSTVSDNRSGNGGNGNPGVNGARGGNGGGICSGGTLTLSDSAVIGNQTGSGGSGGAPSGFAGDAGDGGGILASTLTAVNSTVSGNQARVGGGVRIDGSGSRLTNCTVASNSASQGAAGVLSSATTTVGNTIIAHNNGLDASGGYASQGHNIVGFENGLPTGVCCFFTQPTDKTGTENAPFDPKVGPLANNGGPTKTHALLAGSPAIEAGDNALAKDASDNALTTDQRGAGFPRFADSADADTTQTVDIGAYEAHPTVEDITDRQMFEDNTRDFFFNVGDNALGTLTATASSSDASLVPNDAAHLSVNGTGSERAIHITPAADANGMATITVTVSDADGRTATDTFPLTVTPENDPPTDISLSNNVVADNSPAGTTVGTLSATDPDAGDTFIYQLAVGPGGDDNGSFTTSGSTLKTAAVFDFETKTSYSLRVRAIDQSGLGSVEKVFVVTVTDGPDNLGALSFSSADYSAGEADGAATVKLVRTGGADNKVSAKVSLTHVTTSPDDFVSASGGALDLAFDPGAGADGNVQALAVQPDGKVIIAGDFDSYGGTPRSGVARLNADGSLDTSFNPSPGITGPIISVSTVALQPDGKILIGGAFTEYNGVSVDHIARINPDGSLDNSFSTFSGFINTPSPVLALALQPDGKIIIGGAFISHNGVDVGFIARLNANGSLDTSFQSGTGASNVVQAIVLQPDGKVVIGGQFTSYNGTARARLARLNADGSLDTSFDPGSGVAVDGAHTRGVLSLARQPDGKLIVGGMLVAYNGVPVKGILRVNADGSRDSSFNSGFANNTDVDVVALRPDGKMLVGVTPVSLFSGSPPVSITRLNADGSLDASFNSGSVVNSPNFFTFGINAIALQPDGSAYVGGPFVSYNGTPRKRVARISGDVPFPSEILVTWEAGDASDKTVSLPLVNDSLVEADETLSLSLAALGGATAGAHTSATLTIKDNDTAVSAVSGSGPFGGTATLTATLSGGGAPLEGRSITFTLNGNSVGSATTNASGVATLAGVSLQGLTPGTYPNAVGASFAGDASFAAGSGTGPLTVVKASQTITFDAIPDKTFGDPDFTINATASSGLPVSFGNIAGSSCTVTGNTVHINSAGSCRITATQLGDSNYNGAPAVSRDFEIAQATTSVAVSSSANPSAVGQSVTFTATVTSPAGFVPSGILGTVNFSADGVTIPNCASLLSAGGQGSCTTSALSAGRHVITAEYATTSPNFTGSNGTLQGGQLVGSQFEFGQPSYTVAEGASLTVTVTRTGDTTQAASVGYLTDDGSAPDVVVPCASVTGLALDRCDYTKALGTLNFAAGETSKTLQILVGDDSYVEGAETTHVRLSDPSGAGGLGTTSSATFTITDDSPESAGNTIDNTDDFVRQHYHDFLNREPDAAGLAFWMNQMTNCGNPNLEVCRINVSAAFFKSIEFQETGYLVYRTYKTAYGDATSPGVAGTVPVIRLDEFLPDTQRIGRGVAVGQGAWEAQLEANKQAYFVEFVSRPRFTSAFPTTMTPTQFVDALFASAGVTPTDTQRQDAINEFGGGVSNTANVPTRARVLRSVAENPALNQQEFNRAFVLMEYFGYLRRNPDDAPEAGLNYGGWKFWLDKLNDNGGNFVKAEMVKGFISSDEYRKRFGQ